MAVWDDFLDELYDTFAGSSLDPDADYNTWDMLGNLGTGAVDIGKDLARLGLDFGKNTALTGSIAGGAARTAKEMGGVGNVAKGVGRDYRRRYSGDILGQVYDNPAPYLFDVADVVGGAAAAPGAARAAGKAGRLARRRFAVRDVTPKWLPLDNNWPSAELQALLNEAPPAPRAATALDDDVNLSDFYAEWDESIPVDQSDLSHLEQGMRDQVRKGQVQSNTDDLLDADIPDRLAAFLSGDMPVPVNAEDMVNAALPWNVLENVEDAHVVENLSRPIQPGENLTQMLDDELQEYLGKFIGVHGPEGLEDFMYQYGSEVSSNLPSMNAVAPLALAYELEQLLGGPQR